MNDDKDWKTITTNRFVAFLDIAGTKNRIESLKAEDIYNQLKNIVTVPPGLINSYNDELIHYSVFSDSLVFISKDDTKESLICLLDIVTYSFANAIKEGLPLKGAIAFGEMTADIKCNIFFGQPLVDAFLLQEEKLNYYGIVCHDSFKNGLISLNDEFELNFWLFEYLSMNKIKTESLQYHIDWFRVIRYTNGWKSDLTDLELLENINEKIEQYIKSLYIGEKTSVLECLNNTLLVFEYNKAFTIDFVNSVNKLNRSTINKDPA